MERSLSNMETLPCRRVDQGSPSPILFRRSRRTELQRRMNAFAAVAMACLWFGLPFRRVLLSHDPHNEETSFFQSTHAPTNMLDSAFQIAYNEVRPDSTRSCRFHGDSDCYVRSRVDFETFPYKSRGGLTDSDRELLADLYYNVESVFEYGVGESTMIAASTNLPRFAGVDSSAEWLSTARSNVPDRFRFSFADVGPTREWGYPVSNETLAKVALNYQIAPLRVERDAFDVYFVDGRWRVACVMASFLHAIQSGGDMSKVRVLLHDYAGGRGGPDGSYGIVETIATIETRSEKAVVLVKRPEISSDDIFKVWKRFRHQKS